MAAPPRSLIFETALGSASLVWSEAGLVGSLLPEATRERALQCLNRRFPEAEPGEAPAAVAAAVRRVRAQLEGRPTAFAWSEIDPEVADGLPRRVYEFAIKIPYGSTTTYGAVAKALGGLELSQAVGRALGANPLPMIVPCHRVLGSGGRSGGFSGGDGVATKLRLLNIEGAVGGEAPLLFGQLPLAARIP